MAITDIAGNVYSQVYGAAKNMRAPIQTVMLTSPTTVGASASLVIASFKVPTEPGRVKGVIKGIRWNHGSTVGALGSGITLNCLNITNSSKNCGAVVLDAPAIAIGAVTASGAFTLASTTTDRTATYGVSGTAPASPPAISAEPDVNFMPGDVLSFQAVTLATASLTAGAIQLDIQWLDNF